MKKIRFIHGADLHLDSPFQGLTHLPEPLIKRIRESTFLALQKLINHAVYYKVDFVILAGDLFDGANRSLKAQSSLKKAMEQLYKSGIACYIIHGNHDHLKGNWVNLSWPENVFFFKDKIHYFQYKKEDTSVHLYGYSYPDRSVKENIALQYEKIGQADFHIGILHGTLDGQTGHDNYAPFTVNQLLAKDFDYWALGHIHKRFILHEDPFICYSGNTQGRHKKELGVKGVNLVELENTKSSQVTFLPTAEITWQEVTVSIDEIDEFEELKVRTECCLEEIEEDGSQFVILRLTGSGPLHQHLGEQINELIEVLNSGQEEKANFTYIIDKKLETVAEWDREKLRKEQHIMSDIVTVADRLQESETPLEEMLSEIYSQPKLLKYLELLSTKEQKQLITEAENYLLTALFKERDD